LRGISRLIREGEHVKVVDNDTGSDLTALTLAQIISEQQKNHRDSIPQSILASLIQRNGVHLLEWLNSLNNQLVSSLDWFNVEDMVSVLVKSNLPTRTELLKLYEKVDELEHKIEALCDHNYQNKDT